jgi:hypothetical protein
MSVAIPPSTTSAPSTRMATWYFQGPVGTKDEVERRSGQGSARRSFTRQSCRAKLHCGEAPPGGAAGAGGHYVAPARSTLRLLVVEGLNGVKARGAPRRVIAEDNPDRDGGGDGHE